MARAGTTSAQIDQGDVTPVGFINASGVLAAASSSAPMPTAFGAGMSVNMNIDVDESEDDVKTSAGVLLGYYFANLHASAIRYVRFYNATAANTTVGTTAAIMCLPIPALSAGHVWLGEGIPFSTALCVAATTGVAASDTGAPGANEVVVNTFYR